MAAFNLGMKYRTRRKGKKRSIVDFCPVQEYKNFTENLLSYDSAKVDVSPDYELNVKLQFLMKIIAKR